MVPERDRDPRGPGRDGLAGLVVPEGEDDALALHDLEDLAGGGDAVGVSDQHRPPRPALDPGAGAPPGREALAVLEIAEHGGASGADQDGPLERVIQAGHRLLLLPPGPAPRPAPST